jgi:hypothetical protein
LVFYGSKWENKPENAIGQAKKSVLGVKWRGSEDGLQQAIVARRRHYYGFRCKAGLSMHNGNYGY